MVLATKKEGNVLSGYDQEVLKLVTQFKARCVEQALILSLISNPNITRTNQYNSLASGINYAVKDDPDNVTVTNVKGDTYTFFHLG